MNSFLTRQGNYSRRENYSREKTIWGTTVFIILVISPLIVEPRCIYTRYVILSYILTSSNLYYLVDCKECEKKLPTSTHLRKHVTDRHGSNVNCKDCDKSFNRSGYKQHRTVAHVDKVRIFWEGHKIWKNLPLKIWPYSVTSNFKWKIFSNFVAISEYPDVTKTWTSSCSSDTYVPEFYWPRIFLWTNIFGGTVCKNL